MHKIINSKKPKLQVSNFYLILPPLNLNASNSQKKKEKYKTSTPPSLPSAIATVLFLILDSIYSCWLATVAIPPILDLHLLVFTLIHELNRLRYGESEKFLSSLKFIFVFFFFFSTLLLCLYPLHFLGTGVSCDRSLCCV